MKEKKEYDNELEGDVSAEEYTENVPTEENPETFSLQEDTEDFSDVYSESFGSDSENLIGVLKKVHLNLNPLKIPKSMKEIRLITTDLTVMRKTLTRKKNQQKNRMVKVTLTVKHLSSRG